MQKEIGKKIEGLMQEVLNKTLVTFYKSFDDEVFTKVPHDKETKQLLIASILNIMVQVTGHIFYQMPQMFPGMPMFFDIYKDEVTKAIRDSFEKITIFYMKNQKKEDLEQFIKGQKELDPEDVKTYKELH